MGSEPKNGRVRIGVDLHTLEGLHQGSRTHCLELFSRVPRLLPEVRFLFLADLGRWDKRAAARLEAPNVTFGHMPHTNSIQRLMLQLPGLAKQHGLDLLHTQYIAPPMLRCASAVTVHDILFEDFPEFFTGFFRFRSRVLVRHSARTAKIVCSVSEFSKSDLVRRYGIDGNKITVTYNAADPRFCPGDAGRDEVAALGLVPGEYVLMVGRLEPRKNHQRLMRAYATLPEPRPKLAIVGQRDFRFEEILRLRDELGLGDSVMFLEKVSDAALPALYRHAKVFVYPTLAEGFGMPVIEAMASGVPVITSNTTALPEVAGDAAALVDPYDVEGIGAALATVLGDDERRSAMKARGLEQARRFDWDSEATKLAQVYRAHFGV